MTSLAKYLGGLERTATSTVGQLRASDRRDRLKRIARYWAFMHESENIPDRYAHEIWPGIEELTGNVRLDLTSDFELPLGERVLLHGIVKYKRARTIFEFGTFTGATTTLLAEAAPDGALVHTVDLPDSAFARTGTDGWFTSDLVGKRFVDDPRYAGKIVSHRCDLRNFDFGEFAGKVDLVFVDAAHTYEAVLFDSRLAFEIIAPGGTIVWDDYTSAHWGCVQALNEISLRHPLSRVAHSRFVVCQL